MKDWVNNLNNNDGTSISVVVEAYDDLGQELLNIKKNLVAKLNSKGINSTISESMWQLSEKISQINIGKCTATGEVVATDDGITVTGLPFKPTTVVITSVYSSLRYYGAASTIHRADFINGGWSQLLHYDELSRTGSALLRATDNGFTYTSGELYGTKYRWFAYE